MYIVVIFFKYFIFQHHTNHLMQDCSISLALAMEKLQSFAKPAYTLKGYVVCTQLCISAIVADKHIV